MIHRSQKIVLNSKILLVAIIAAFAGIIGFIALSGSQIINDVSEGGLGSTSAPIQVQPLELELDKLSVLSVSEQGATLQIDFKVTNPNAKSVILQIIKYQLYEEGGKRVTIQQIGERPEGMVDASNYFTILSNNPQIIGETFTIKNTGNDPEFWSALSDNNVKWTVKGEAYFNLSSMTSGQENITQFEFET